MPDHTRETVVGRYEDDFGEITVSDCEDFRNLYFGRILQSSIRLESPWTLVDAHHKAMMSAMLFMKNPEAVLVVGLGGCSLIHFLRRAFPVCGVDVVEIREKVIDLAREFFLLPRNNERIRVFHASGEDFISGREARGDYDLLIVDAFDESGPAAPLLEADFLSACGLRLGRKGVFVMNLWNRPEDDFGAFHEKISEAFRGNTLRILLPDPFRNAIVLASNDPEAFSALQSKMEYARELQSEFEINFPGFLRAMLRENPIA